MRRGTATEVGCRKELGIQGLLPPRETSLQAEINRAHAAISRCCTPLDKYQVNRRSTLPLYRACSTCSICSRTAHSTLWLQAVMGLREASWDIFYGLLSQHIKEYLPIIYTP